jgi:hypothetical protein
MELAQFQAVEVESFKTAICGDVLNITGCNGLWSKSLGSAISASPLPTKICF